jgi:hypothetical protein
MARIQLHPDARAAFNKRGDELVAKLRPIVREQSQTYDFPGVHVAASFEERDLSELVFTQRNHAGREISRMFRSNDGTDIGLDGEGHVEFIKLTDAILATQSVRPHLSRGFVRQVTFDWLRRSHQQRLSETLCDNLSRVAETAITTHTIWIPVSDLFLETDLAFGRVELRTMSRAIFDEHVAQLQVWHTDPELLAGLNRRAETYRRTFQGHAAVVVTLEAEPAHAEEAAIAIAEETIDLLRVYHPGQLIPRTDCQLDVYGQSPDRTTTCLLFRDGMWVETREAATAMPLRRFLLSRRSIAAIGRAHFSKASEFLRVGATTPFQQLALDALRRYSKGVLAHTEEDRLLYVLVAAESLLLLNSSEPIQEKIADRMAFFLETQAEARRDVVGAVKAAYSARSSYVHHGRGIEEEAALAAFFPIAWRFFIGVIGVLDQHRTREDFIRSIDDVKYS